ncbi:hypothetical protein ABEB36_007353 [Hypothenemus hampei]|uniref:C2H2-type domain-containing protein n=1 Tax=Hypothenemus hampei TaxID=57062 RepID=A0ABD1EW07_HYPHA
MKTEQLTGGQNGPDPIWNNSVELLPSEECLPIIGSCQVSSILQNLDSSNEQSPQNMDLIILNGNDYKLPLEAPLNLHSNNYMVLKDPNSAECGRTLNQLMNSRNSENDSSKIENLNLIIAETSNSSNNSATSPKHYDKESFEDMLYFVCNLCPFLCTKETKITEHLEGFHKFKTLSKLVQLKCPACANIFYHRASLKSHLLHDHCVESSDISLIVQAVIFYSNKENKRREEERNLVDSKELLKEQENNNRNSVKEGVKSISKAIELQVLPSKVTLPQMDITSNKSEKLITNLMKKNSLVVKYINSEKCAYASCKILLADPKKMSYHVECHCDNGFKCPECQVSKCRIALKTTYGSCYFCRRNFFYGNR